MNSSEYCCGGVKHHSLGGRSSADSVTEDVFGRQESLGVADFWQILTERDMMLVSPTHNEVLGRLMSADSNETLGELVRVTVTLGQTTVAQASLPE